MNCLSCELPLEKESDTSAHFRCLHQLFGTSFIPKINFATTDIQHEAQKLIGKMSISGVQPKLSVAVNKKTKGLEVVPLGGTHILKPSPESFPFSSENDNLCMNLALEMGIETPPHGLVRMSDDRLAYLARRFDRGKQGEKIHVEDFSQLLGKSDKYDGSAEQIGKFLKRYSSVPFIDTQKLFARILFYFLIGNGDAHLKNFSMVQSTSGYRLAPAYDIICSRVVLPSETDEMAIAISGRKNRIDRRDFESLADSLEINPKQRERFFTLARVLDMKMMPAIARSFLPEKLKRGIQVVFEERFERLFGGS